MSEGSPNTRVNRRTPEQNKPGQHTSGDAELEAFQLQNLRLRDELIGAEVKLGELRERVLRLEARCQRTEDLCALRLAHVDNELEIGAMYEQQVKEMLASTTWRVGRAIVRPSFAIRRTLGGS